MMFFRSHKFSEIICSSIIVAGQIRVKKMLQLQIFGQAPTAADSSATTKTPTTLAATTTIYVTTQAPTR